MDFDLVDQITDSIISFELKKTEEVDQLTILILSKTMLVEAIRNLHNRRILPYNNKQNWRLYKIHGKLKDMMEPKS